MTVVNLFLDQNFLNKQYIDETIIVGCPAEGPSVVFIKNMSFEIIAFVVFECL